MAYWSPGTHIPASAGAAGFNWREKGLALPGFMFQMPRLGWRRWGLGSAEAMGWEGRAGPGAWHSLWLQSQAPSSAFSSWL